jgi:hypothetical protein
MRSRRHHAAARQDEGRAASLGRPRPSLEERYPTPGDYVAAVEASARKLVEDRLLLDEDAKRIVERAAQAM